jgi:cytochrome c-type biogenesis protein
MSLPINVATAFFAGFISFISPCVLPLLPSYLSFLTGISLEDLKTTSSSKIKAEVLAHACAFIAGFTLIFMLIGLSAGVIGGTFAAYKSLIARLGGAVIILLGLHMIGVFRIPLLAMDKRLHLQPRKPSLPVSFAVGIGFAAGWSPCIGPILSGIILLAGGQELPRACFLLFAYAMGLALPFLITAGAITQSLTALDRIKPLLPSIEIASGVILTATGIVVATNSFTRIVGTLYQYVRTPSL